MPYISNDPTWWPAIYHNRIMNYFWVVSVTAVVYDWALTFGQEFELVWMRHWSLMTVLYICVRYLGILFSVVQILGNLPFSITDQVSTIIYFTEAWIPVAVNAMLGGELLSCGASLILSLLTYIMQVIMIVRIHAMYQQSRKILIFLVVVLLASTIASGVMTVIANIDVSGVEQILSGIHLCGVYINADNTRLTDETLIPTTVWEILALFLAAWIVIKHFREMQQSPTGSTIGDCFMVLIRSHVLYFIVFAAVSFVSIVPLFTNIQTSLSMAAAIWEGIYPLTQMVQMFVLGPRLILSVREYHAKLVTDSDEGTGMTTIAFQEGGHVLTGGDV
ncbi:hypothetical protein DFH29DRAFT_617601 [Suillus ampliporus]|nr:hypothetical protein DFH29DRAFT_617601 [Suillus ampliporus]